MKLLMLHPQFFYSSLETGPIIIVAALLNLTRQVVFMTILAWLVVSNESVLSFYQYNISEMGLYIQVSDILQLDFLVGNESKNVQYNNIFSVGSSQ